MLGEWQGGPVEPSDDEAPTLDDPQPVDVPGSPEAFAGEDAVAYRTQFPDPRDDDESRATLELRGLYGSARVWHNGELLGTHDAYFVPADFQFEPEDENEIVVECRRPTDEFGGVYETDLLPEADRVPGIWWDASLYTHGPASFVDLSVTPRLGEDHAVLDAAMTVDAAEPVDEQITLSLRPEGFRSSGTMDRANVEVAAGERVTVTREIDIRDPKYWWPRDLGSQHRYTVTAKLNGHERTATTGFCTVDYDSDDGLRVNGRRLPARGFNVLPSSDPADAVDAAVEANANLLRAHAHVPPQSFHEACDEAGVLVWQDMPLTGDVEYDVERGEELAGTLADRYGPHPSLAAYGVHDDPRSPFDPPLGEGRLSRLRLRWRAWRTGVDRSGAERIAAAFDDDRPTFPVAGSPGTDPDAGHVYPGWAYGNADDVDWLLDTYPTVGRVVGEFGAGSLVDGADDTVPRISKRLDADDPAATRREQAQTLKRVSEALRRNGTDVLAAFALQDARDDGGMGVLDSDGGEKVGHAALADSYEPVQAVLDELPTPGGVGITVINDTHEEIDGTLTWEAGDRTGTVDVTAEPLSRVDAGGAKVPGSADEIELSLIVDDREVSNTYLVAD